jgi:RNA polymerase sigma factor (sigma-70 family)
MPTSPLTDLLQQVRRSELLKKWENTSDGQLLECWVRGRDSVALETLVLRHGPMVWGICCRALPSHHDAEDAFQAAFLVFVKKVATVRTPELLANWLYGVALQTARKARQAALKRQAREKQVTQLPEPKDMPHDQEFGPDLRRQLDEELGRLPDKYRTVILLCDVQGKSRPEAARQLRLPEGTVASRLARGREMLAKRLTRRGVTVSGATLAVALSRQAVSASVPTMVLSNTIKVATLLAAGEGAGAVSAQVSALTKGVLTTTSLPKLKTAAIVLLIASLVLAGGLVTHRSVVGSWLPFPSPPPVTADPGSEADARAIAAYLPWARAVLNSGAPPGPGFERQRKIIEKNATTSLDTKTGYWTVTYDAPFSEFPDGRFRIEHPEEMMWVHLKVVLWKRPRDQQTRGQQINVAVRPENPPKLDNPNWVNWEVIDNGVVFKSGPRK